MVTAKSKKRLGALIGLIIIILIINCVYPLDKNAKYVTDDNEITYKKYMVIPYGEGEAALGHVTVEGPKPMYLGPNSFSVTSDGGVFILDTVNYKIKRYSSGGIYMYSIALPKNIWGLDFEVMGNTVYLMGGDYNLYKKSVGGDEWVKLGTYSIMSLAGLYSQGSEVYGRAWDGADFTLTGSRPVEYNEKVIMTKAGDIKQTVITKDGAQYYADFAAQMFNPFIIKNNGDTAYIYEYEALMKNVTFGEIRIGKYVNGLKTETALAAPLKYYINVNSFKKVYVTDSGEVYQMIPLESGIAISIVPWFSGEKTRITEAMIAANEVSS
jgi:hypothetical protein